VRGVFVVCGLCVYVDLLSVPHPPPMERIHVSTVFDCTSTVLLYVCFLFVIIQCARVLGLKWVVSRVCVCNNTVCSCTKNG
jgi:hypothetical protein